MTLITCSNFDVRVFRLFDTFRMYHSSDRMIWLLTGQTYIPDNIISAIKKHYGNMTIEQTIVAEDFWQYEPCLHQPQWGLFLKYSYLLQCDDIVLRCDGTDVLFQSKVILPIIKDNVVYCGYEDAIYRNSPWLLTHFDPAYRELYIDNVVVNSGVLLTNGKTFNNIAYHITNCDKHYTDQNQLQYVADTKSIELKDEIEIIAAGNKPHDIKDNVVFDKNGYKPSIVHYCGSNVTQASRIGLERLYSNAKCKETYDTIVGEIE